jgi:hypothetical protein
VEQQPSNDADRRGSFVPVRAAADDSLRRGHLRTLIALASFANGKRETFASQATIAERAGMHARTVRDCIAQLEELGYVEVDRKRVRQDGGRTSNLYRIVFDPPRPYGAPDPPGPTGHRGGRTNGGPRPSRQRGAGGSGTTGGRRTDFLTDFSSALRTEEKSR